MARPDIPATPAIRALRAGSVEFTPHPYPYVDRGGTAHAAQSLGVDPHAVVKTLVMEARGDGPKRQPLLVVMHGDREVSTKALARVIGVKSVSPCNADSAQKHTGYKVGGTSPFATRKPLPVYMEKTIQDLQTIYINGGKRGFLVGLSPQIVIDLLAPTLVNVGIEPS